MFQYGYANFEHKGYCIASQNDFFRDGEREKQLRQLVGHSAASEDFAVSFLGITTDMNLPEETQRFFFQMSGREKYRSADYAQGIVQDLNQRDFPFFEEGFLTVLKARFMSGEELEAIPFKESGDHFPDIGSPQTEEDLKPAGLEEKLLARILDNLMDRKRVILKLDRSGEEAVWRSREVLLRIYECLPYGVRKYAGFCTNVAPARFEEEDENKKLPDAVRLCLVDGDKNLPRFIPGYQLYDMNQSAENGYEPDDFLRFLMQDQERETYFKMVSESCEMAQEEQIGKEIYRNAFGMHALAEQELSQESMSEWVRWYKKASSPAGKKLRKEFARILSGKLDFQEMLRLVQREAADPAAMLLLFQEICECDAENEKNMMQKLGRKLAEADLEEIQEKVREKRLRIGAETVPEEQTLKLFAEWKAQALRSAKERGPSEIARLARQYLMESLDEQEALLQQEYEEEKRRELDRFAESLLELENAEVITFKKLKALYAEARQEERYPLCAREMKEKDFITAYSQEYAVRLRVLFMKRPLPENLDELSDFVEDWKAANKDAFFAQGFWDAGRRKEVQNFVDSAAKYCKKSGTESLAGQLALLWELWVEPKYGWLGGRLIEQARERCRRGISENEHEEWELLENLMGCYELAEYERECVEKLCRPLWTVDVSEPDRCRRLLAEHEKWEMLGARLNCDVTIQKEGKRTGTFPVREAVNQILQMTDERYQLLQHHRKKLLELVNELERTAGLLEEMETRAAALERKEEALSEQKRSAEKLLKRTGWILCALPVAALTGILFVFVLFGIIL